MATFTINIDANQKCKQCGKGNAVNGNICMDCHLKNLKSGKYDPVLKKAKEGVGEILERIK